MSEDQAFAAIVERVEPGGRLLGVQRLTGGVSADVHALDVRLPRSGRRRIVVRRHGAAAWKAQHADVATMEHGVLKSLHEAGLPVPEPLLLDTSGALLPGPFLVMTFVDGETVTIPADAVALVEDMAAALVQLHRLPTASLPPLPARLDPLPEVFDYLAATPSGPTLRTRLEAWQDTAYRGIPVLLHGDFWPGNLLWRRGRLVAILDWEDAALGDPMADVAGACLELTWALGPAAAGRFVSRYEADRTVDRQRLALWTIYVASAGCHFMHLWGLAPDREAAMRAAAAECVAQAGRVLDGFAPAAGPAG